MRKYLQGIFMIGGGVALAHDAIAAFLRKPFEEMSIATSNWTIAWLLLGGAAWMIAEGIHIIMEKK